MFRELGRIFREHPYHPPPDWVGACVYPWSHGELGLERRSSRQPRSGRSCRIPTQYTSHRATVTEHLKRAAMCLHYLAVPVDSSSARHSSDSSVFLPRLGRLPPARNPVNSCHATLPEIHNSGHVLLWHLGCSRSPSTKQACRLGGGSTLYGAQCLIQKLGLPPCSKPIPPLFTYVPTSGSKVMKNVQCPL